MCKYSLLVTLALARLVAAQPKADTRFPFFAYLIGEKTPKMIAYTPSELDPRQEGNHRLLKTSSIRADLEALRSHASAFEAFDLPWKAEASGLPVEKHWGLFSPDRKPYPALDVCKAYGK